MNLKQIRSLVKRNTKADSMNMPDESINFFINLAQKEIVRQTLCLKKSASVLTKAGVIAAITNGGAGTVNINTVAANTLSTGDLVTLTGTSYDGVYAVTVADESNFSIVDTFVATGSSGYWSQHEYALPSDFHKSSAMKIGSIFLEYKIEEEIDRLYTTDPDRGTPYYYYIDREAGTYGLYPIPGDGYAGKFTYRAIPATLSSDTATPDIPELYHDAIVMGASYRVAEQMNQIDLKMHYLSMFNMYMGEIANDMSTRNTESFPVVVTSKDILDA